MCFTGLVGLKYKVRNRVCMKESRQRQRLAAYGRNAKRACTRLGIHQRGGAAVDRCEQDGRHPQTFIRETMAC